MKKVSVLVVAFLLMASVSFAEKLGFGKKSSVDFTVSSFGKEIIVNTRNVTFKINKSGQMFKKEWKEVNKNEDASAMIFSGTTGIMWNALPSGESSTKECQLEIVKTDNINGFNLKYYQNKELLEIEHDKIHAKIWGCGKAEVEEWKYLNY